MKYYNIRDSSNNADDFEFVVNQTQSQYGLHLSVHAFLHVHYIVQHYAIYMEILVYVIMSVMKPFNYYGKNKYHQIAFLSTILPTCIAIVAPLPPLSISE